MRSLSRSLIALFCMWLTVSAQIDPGISIISPQQGEALQGVVSIIGSSRIDGFVSGEVSYAYQDGTDNWFLIRHLEKTVDNDVLAFWDTSIITDGAYRIKLHIFLEGGEFVEVIVGDLRVRNYTPVETETPGPAQTPGSGSNLPTPTVTLAPQPTPTNLPENPASIHDNDLYSALWTGMISGFLVMIGAGIFFGWLKPGHNKRMK